MTAHVPRVYALFLPGNKSCRLRNLEVKKGRDRQQQLGKEKKRRWMIDNDRHLQIHPRTRSSFQSDRSIE